MILHSMVARLLLFLLATFAFAGCRSKDGELMISNVGGEEIIAISKARDQGSVTQLHIRVEGELQGAAQLILLKEGQPHHVETLTGTVNVRWQGDWYDDRARLNYIPGPSVSGSLRVRYRFVD